MAQHCASAVLTWPSRSRRLVKVWYMLDKLGQEFSGSSAGHWFGWRRLDEVHVEGLVHISSQERYYNFEPAHLSLNMMDRFIVG